MKSVDTTYLAIWLRGAITKKNGKIWEKFPIRLGPPPSDNSELFEFQNFLKTSDPPLGSNSELFEFQTFLIKVILQNNCKIIAK